MCNYVESLTLGKQQSSETALMGPGKTAAVVSVPTAALTGEGLPMGASQVSPQVVMVAGKPACGKRARIVIHKLFEGAALVTESAAVLPPATVPPPTGGLGASPWPSRSQCPYLGAFGLNRHWYRGPLL
jgi:hypothetical protein